MKNKTKKFYNFTKKQKQRDRTKNGKQNWNAPSWYRKMFNDELKAQQKQTLRKILQGREVEFPVFKRNVRWYYW